MLELLAALGVHSDVGGILVHAGALGLSQSTTHKAHASRPRYEMSLSDRLFLSRLRARDEDAFAEVVHTHGDRVFNLVLRLVGSPSEAEDIAQEVFVTVFKSIESYRGEARLSTWILRIAANHAKNRIKYLARRRTTSQDSTDTDAMEFADEEKNPVQAHFDAPDVAFEAAETERFMQQAIAKLDDEQRLLVVLRDVEDLSYEEIVEITGLVEGTVKSRLHRARMALKTMLEDKFK